MVVPLLLSVSLKALLWGGWGGCKVSPGPPSAPAASGSSDPLLRLRCFLRSWSACLRACACSVLQALRRQG